LLCKSCYATCDSWCCPWNICVLRSAVLTVCSVYVWYRRGQSPRCGYFISLLLCCGVLLFRIESSQLISVSDLLMGLVRHVQQSVPNLDSWYSFHKNTIGCHGPWDRVDVTCEFPAVSHRSFDTCFHFWASIKVSTKRVEKGWFCFVDPVLVCQAATQVCNLHYVPLYQIELLFLTRWRTRPPSFTMETILLSQCFSSFRITLLVHRVISRREFCAQRVRRSWRFSTLLAWDSCAGTLLARRRKPFWAAKRKSGLELWCEVTSSPRQEPLLTLNDSLSKSQCQRETSDGDSRSRITIA